MLICLALFSSVKYPDKIYNSGISKTIFLFSPFFKDLIIGNTIMYVNNLNSSKNSSKQNLILNLRINENVFNQLYLYLMEIRNVAVWQLNCLWQIFSNDIDGIDVATRMNNIFIFVLLERFWWISLLVCLKLTTF